MVSLRASAETFPEEDQWKDQDQKIAPICLPTFYQWRVRGRTGHMHPWLTTRERCIKRPA